VAQTIRLSGQGEIMKKLTVLILVLLSFQNIYSAYGNGSSSRPDCCSKSSADANTDSREASCQFGTRSVFPAFSGILEAMLHTNVSYAELEKQFNYIDCSTNTVYYYIPLIVKAYKLNISSSRLSDHSISDLNKIIQSNLMNDSRVIITYENDNKSHGVMVYGQILDSAANISGYIANDPAIDAENDIIDARTLISQHWKLRVANLYWFK
jgi:hypothetical protein